MAKSRKRANTPQAKRFGKAARECWGQAKARGGFTSPKQLGTCMKSKLRKGKRK